MRNPENAKMRDPITYARTVLSGLPGAISGSGGHNATFAAACRLIRLGLDDAQALELLSEWNGTHCKPPWSDGELRHKISDARRKAGHLARFRPSAPAVRTLWRKLKPSAPVSLPPSAPPPPANTLDELPAREHAQPHEAPRDRPDTTAEPCPPPPAARIPARIDPYLAPDERPWLPVAKDILAGRYRLTPGSTLVDALRIGLRSINHPVCQTALQALPGPSRGGQRHGNPTLSNRESR